MLPFFTKGPRMKLPSQTLKASFWLILSLLCIWPATTQAQLAKDSFGRNRMQYKKFDWRYYSTENFDVYYYEGGADLAQKAASFLEEEFDRITDLLGFGPYSKTKVFLYTSVTDLQQSNIGVHNSGISVGGQTDFVESHFEVAYPGNTVEFKKELIFGVSNLLIDEMMFGGSLTEMFQNAVLLSLPKWFTIGAASYAAYGWDVAMDDYMRDLLRNGRQLKLTELDQDEAALVGRSIWNYIAEVYGPGYISHTLNLTRIIRNEEKSINNTLGISYKEFIAGWLAYYRGINQGFEQTYTSPDPSQRLVKKNRKNFRYQDEAFSPNGQYLAYTYSHQGRYYVVLKNLQTQKEKILLKSGYKVIDQQTPQGVPLLSWKDDQVLGIVGPRKGGYAVWLYNVENNRKQRRDLGRFQQVRSFDYNDAGNLIVMSVVIEGQTDLYLVSLRKNAFRRITNDAFDELDPVFVPGQNTFLFSSNRTTDTLSNRRKGTQTALKQVPERFNIFAYNLDTTRQVLARVTNLLGQSRHPKPLNGSRFLFLSNQKGINSLYSYSLQDSIVRQVSNFDVSIRHYDVLPDSSTLAVTIIKDGDQHLYIIPDYDLTASRFTPMTARQQKIQAKFLAKRIQEREAAKPPVNNELALTRPAGKKDSTAADSVATPPLNPLDSGETDVIDTENYVFDAEVVKQKEAEILNAEDYVFDSDFAQKTRFGNQEKNILTKYRKAYKEDDVLGPFPYERRFTADNLITGWRVDPLRGFGFDLQMKMNDLLENHKFYGGLLSILDLRNGDLFLEYQYLKNRVDLHARYDRNVIFRQTENALQKYALNTFEIGASLPLTVRSRLMFAPFYANTIYNDLDPGILSAGGGADVSTLRHFTGARASFVYDNTIATYINTFEGIRGRADFETWRGLTDANRSFSKLSIDIRGYQKIYKEFIFATRVYYGKFFGPNPQNFMLGGMDNWLFNSTEQDGNPENPLLSERGIDNSNILFSEFVTNLRGFNYNTLYGNNVLLFNAELRLPLVKLLYNGPIESPFLRNLQFVGFYDIGSAWTGSSPFLRDNSLNTDVIKNPGSNFEAVVQNFKNPWLSGYGAGLRTVLLGYYMKFDLAWPVEDFATGDPRFFITLGYDF